MTPELRAAAEQHHKRAMELAEMAMDRRRDPRDRTVPLLFEAALDHESWVADRLRDRYDLEPSRSIVCRSAATLALDCGRIDEAERLAATGLSGSAPPEIAAQLRDVLFEVQYRRHLNHIDDRLVDDVIHLTIVGPAVTGNRIDPDVFASRMETMHSLIVRVHEKLLTREFRGAVRRPLSLHERLPIQIEPSSNGAFGMDFFARIRQPDLPLLVAEGGVTDSIMRVMRDVTEGRRSSLLKFCSDDRAYYTYFVSSVRSMLPDGKKVKAIGVATRNRATGIDRINMNAGTREIASRMSLATEKAARVTVTGTLNEASQPIDSSGTRVKVTADERSEDQSFFLPEGITSDLLGRYWNTRVVITGAYRSENAKYPTLDEIDSADA